MPVPKEAAVVYIPAQHPSTPPTKAALPNAKVKLRAVADALLDDVTQSVEVQRYDSVISQGSRTVY